MYTYFVNSKALSESATKEQKEFSLIVHLSATNAQFRIGGTYYRVSLQHMKHMPLQQSWDLRFCGFAVFMIYVFG